MHLPLTPPEIKNFQSIYFQKLQIDFDPKKNCFSYGMRPSIPARPAFARYGSTRQQHEPSSGDESQDDTNNKAATADTDDAASDQLSVSFSDVDDNDSVNEISSVREKVIEEEEEVDSRDATPKSTPSKHVLSKPPLPSEPAMSRFTGGSGGSYREPSINRLNR